MLSATQSSELTGGRPLQPSQDPSWFQDGGVHRLLGGSTLNTRSDPHFHETYIIAHVKRGVARMNARRRLIELTEGSVILVNSYEVTSCLTGEGFDYDICYPTREFMVEASLAAGLAPGTIPLFSHLLPSGRAADALRNVLARFADGEGSPAATIESELLRVLRKYPTLLVTGGVENFEHARIRQACEVIEASLDEPISISELSQRVNASRSHFVRSFRRATGLPPRDYIRQLRLARGMEQIRQGNRLADIAFMTGFADQPHFTREFKRVYGTTPGKFARDIEACCR